jgi:predicted HNH restriction endonuclease
MAWATTGEVLTYTGITVTEAEIQQAQFMVEMFADVTEDAVVSTKNLRFLKMATAYQAAWITEHPDLFTHVDVSTMLQDGLQFTRGHENATLLAPMARRAINRLSWRRNRSIKIRPPKRRTMKGLQQIEWMGSGSVGTSRSEGNAFESSTDGGAWEDE